MLNSVNPIDRIAAARLLEFLGPSPPWHRSLWNIGVVLELRELYEACEAASNSILSDKSVQRLVSSLLRKAGKDPALTREEKAHLREQLQQPKVPRIGSAQHHTIRRMADPRLDRLAICGHLAVDRVRSRRRERRPASHRSDNRRTSDRLAPAYQCRLKIETEL